MVTISLSSKKGNCVSEHVSMEDLIFHQNDIEFVFPDYTDDYDDEPHEVILPYKDFLSFQDDYNVIVHIAYHDDPEKRLL